ncbi:MAG TPA: sigma-70 family RNA polymerase sigma factor [Chthoniobacteraceae bacterium]|nr:sigma-70 family RNA polymerase sigma factor [Chthoniobacteraceae bacterium]
MMRSSAGGQFVSTRWTQVLAAADPEHPEAREALEELCSTYWRPLYCYVRRQGHGPADSEDLTQGFFARLLRLESLAQVRRERGRFRAFLLASMKHYLADERDRECAEKRGAGRIVPLETGDAETRFRVDPIDPALTPDQVFDREWAIALLERVTTQLQSDYADGQRELFAALSFCLTGSQSDVPYAELATRLGMNEPAIRVAVHRMRKRYREILRDEVASTVNGPEEVDDELRQLRRALAGV